MVGLMFLAEKATIKPAWASKIVFSFGGALVGFRDSYNRMNTRI